MGTRKSTTGGQGRFSQVPGPQIERSVLQRNCGHKLTMDAGVLVPIFVDEVLPGDTLSLKATLFGRIATLLHPIMDNMYLDTFFFAVPNRIVWENWEKFMGQQEDPGDSTDYTIPQVDFDVATVPVGSIFDHVGLPTGMTDCKSSSLFFRAINLIWNEWFRDQNLQDSREVPKGDGPDLYTLFGPNPPRGKRHDYFTSCLPWAQKGSAITVPLGTTAPVVSAGDGIPTFTLSTTDGLSLIGDQGQQNVEFSSTLPTGFGIPAEWYATKLEADLSGATAVTINNLREGFQIQRLLERDARGGTRYAETIRSHFGVVSPDQRLQRPEYLGGSTQPLFVREVPSTVDVDEGNPQANLAAYGTVTSHGKGFHRSFTEHSMVIGFACLRADLTYQQGTERMFTRLTKHDFYWPALAHLGEQAVLQKEIFTSGVPAEDDLVFGYQERYAEYRYKLSRVSGDFRSDASASLDTWHLAQDFATAPVLDSDFIVEDPPIDRVIAVPSEPHLLLDTFFEYRCARPMPTYSVPGLIDHF